MIQNGHIGQVLGPFEAGLDLLADEGPIGILTPEKERPVLYKLGIQTEVGTIVQINDKEIKIGKTGIYELDDVIKITNIVFPNGASSDIIIDFIYTGRAW